ncbi:hypothetical protein AB0M79_26725 [Polymorphospora sp. NPDC051019]|uniref:hypothetical protein n=1 Tax=Polymorphospora sp. NPDC051019 TaxID=3155725 RepID=UPI00343905EF
MKPRQVICVLGTGLDLDLVEKLVAEVGGPGFSLDREFAMTTPDPRMLQSFESCLTNATFTAADRQAVSGHDSVAYILSPPMGDKDMSFHVAARMLALTAALLRAGATAVKCESSGLTHGRDRWLELADLAADAPSLADLTKILYYAWVKRPLSDDDRMYTCGMHLLGEPDVEIEADGLADPERLDDWVELIDGLAVYLLTEVRTPDIRSGEGFRLAPDAPRWILTRRACHRYADDDFFYNPYGHWLLTPG